MDPPGGRSPGRNMGPDRKGHDTATPHPPVLTSSDGHQSGRYAFCWNAYLLIKYFKITIALDKLKENIKYDFSLSFHKIQCNEYTRLLSLRFILPTAKQNGFTGNWERIYLPLSCTPNGHFGMIYLAVLSDAKESASLHPLAKEERQKQPARTAIHLRSPPTILPIA